MRKLWNNHKKVPCESYNSLGPVERYHAPLRRIYSKIKIENPSLSNQVVLSIVVHGMNSTANPEGLMSILLVFGSVPKIPIGNLEHLAPNQRTHFAAMEASRKEMERIVAGQRLKLACKFRMKGMDVFSICSESKVLVYREKLKKWDGPFTLHKYDNYKTA